MPPPDPPPSHPSSDGPEPPAAPSAREQLVDVRWGLLRLHKALIDAERAALERERGPIAGGTFLQMLIEDPRFEWLRPFTALIVQIDEALAGVEPLSGSDARELIERTRALVAPVGMSPATSHRMYEAWAADERVRHASDELSDRLRGP